MRLYRALIQPHTTWNGERPGCVELPTTDDAEKWSKSSPSRDTGDIDQGLQHRHDPALARWRTGAVVDEVKHPGHLVEEVLFRSVEQLDRVLNLPAALGVDRSGRAVDWPEDVIWS